MEDQLRPSRAARLRNNIVDTYQQTKYDLWEVQLHNIRTFRRQPLAEISGSVGDIGTLLPLLIALTETKSIYLSSTLVFSGLANIFTGVFFGVPLPVQPMKAIAAVAIARNFSPEENASAGLFVAAAIGFLSSTGLIQWFTRRIPIPVIKGIQVGTGLSLVMSAGNLYHVNPLNNVILLLVFLGLLASSRFPRVPYALILLLIGVVFVVILKRDSNCEDCTAVLGLGIWHPRTLKPTPNEFITGTLDAGIGQLPLTTLNSVIAVSFLAADLLPNVPTPSTTSLGLSVMAINLVGCWFGAMPVCHGSGGLAAQYSFGARSGASIIFLGLIKLMLGLFAEKITYWVFNGFSSTLLSILVIAAGLELAKVGESLNTAGARDLNSHDRSLTGSQRELEDPNDKTVIDLTNEERKRRWTVMLMTVAGILAFHNDAVGFLAGILCHGSFLLLDRLENQMSRREGFIRLGDHQPGDSHEEAP